MHFTDAPSAIYVAEFATENTHNITLSPGAVASNLDFGVRALPGKISGIKFNDLDGDAEPDVNEPGLSGRTIYLDTNNNQLIDTGEPSTVTDVDGSYSFTNLATLTTYSVVEVPQEGWEQTFPEVEDAGRWTVVLEAGERRTGINFGNRQSTSTGGAGNTGKLSGRVTDSAGTPLANRKVYIDLNESRFLDAQSLGMLEPNFTTGTDGIYQFTGLAPGTYTVRVVVPLGEDLDAPIGNRLDSTTVPGIFEGPQSIVVGQFTNNNDNHLDLVVVNGSAYASGTNEVTVLANNGSGQFTRAGNDLPVGALPVAIASGHFNNDTHLDIAVANSYSSNVSILMGTGNASAPFSPATNHLVTTNPGVNGYGPRAIVAGHFNADTKIDLAVANEGSGDVSILLNNGNGVFQSLSFIDWNTTGRPFSIAAGKFNADDALDLVVAEYDSDSNNDSLRVLFNNGSGVFTPGPSITVGNGPRSVAVGYFNDDSYLDLAAANTLGNTVSLVFGNGAGTGNGNGTFGSAITLPAGSGPTSVTPVDIDNDSDIDLVVSNKSAPNKAAVLRNLGNGAFAALENLGSAVFPDAIGFAVATGYVDGDELSDVVLINTSEQTGQGEISVLLNERTSGGHRRTITNTNPEAPGLDFVFQVTVPALPGDYNRNGSVDAADYVLWRRSLNSTVTQYSGADGDGTGVITSTDYGVWRSHFGNVPAGGSDLDLPAGAAETAPLALPSIAAGTSAASSTQKIQSSLQSSTSFSAMRLTALPPPPDANGTLHRATLSRLLGNRTTTVRLDAAFAAWLEKRSNKPADQYWESDITAFGEEIETPRSIEQNALDGVYREIGDRRDSIFSQAQMLRKLIRP